MALAADGRIPVPPTLQLFGGFQLESGLGPEARLSAKKPIALLTYLAVRRGQPQTRDKLAALLWEDRPQAQAKGSLRQAILQLRRGLPEGVLRAEGENVSLGESIDVDVIRFRESIDAADPASLEEAVSLYRGDLLEGFHPRAPVFEEWLTGEREVLRQLAVQALDDLLAHAEDAGDYPRAIRAGVRLLSLDPMQESLHRKLMRLHAEQGQRGAALRQYRVLRELLANEFDAAPQNETEALHRAIREGRVGGPPSSGADSAVADGAVASRESPRDEYEVEVEDGESPNVAELRPVTIVSVQLSDEELLTSQSVERARERERAFEGRVEAAAATFGGQAIKQLGGHLVIAFGIQRAHSRDAGLAARAAMSLRTGGEDTPAGDDDAGSAYKIGIASGQIMVDPRDLDAPPLLSGSAISSAAALAARCPPGDVLVTASLRRGLIGRAQCEPGRDELANTWRLLAVSDSSAHGDEYAPPQRPFVGRSIERRLLESSLEVCRKEGLGHTFLIRGDAGIGKTRLVNACRERAAALGFGVHGGELLDFGTAGSRTLLASLSRQLLGLDANADDERVRSAAEAAVRASVIRDSERVLLEDLLDVSLSSELRALREAMDVETRRRGRAEVLVRLVTDACERQPRLLVIEDLHWGDADILECIAALLRAVGELSAVLVMTSRIEDEPEQGPWKDGRLRTPFTAIELTPLRTGEALEFAHHFSAVDEAQVTACVERADGNPLFLEQLLLSISEGESELPTTIQSIVVARLDALTPMDRDALRVASILGQRFSVAGLRTLLGRDDYEGEGFVEAGLVDVVAPGEMRFSHALIHEAVYGSVPETRRSELHRRAAQWYEPTEALVCAEHLERAGDPGAAAAYLRAATELSDEYRHERALEIAGRGRDLANDERVHCELDCIRGDRLIDLGQIDEALSAYEEAERHAIESGERCRAWLGVANAMRLTDRREEALARLERAEAEAQGAGLEEALAKIYFQRGNLLFPMGDIDGCLAAHEAALRSARSVGSKYDEASALGGLGDAYYQRGQMIRAHQHYDECIELARRLGYGRIEVANLHMRGVTLMYLGRAREARAEIEEAIRLAGVVGNRRAQMVAHSCTGDVLVWIGDWPSLEEDSRNTAEGWPDLRTPGFEAMARCYQGYAAAVQGRLEEGDRWIAEGLRCAGDSAFAGPFALGVVAATTRDDAERQRALEEGERLLEDGSVSHNHFCFRVFAMQACLAAGDLEAVEHHASALDAYTADEPLPWSRFFSAWGRALAEHARGEGDVDELLRLRSEAVEFGLGAALPLLDRAL